MKTRHPQGLRIKPEKLSRATNALLCPARGPAEFNSVALLAAVQPAPLTGSILVALALHRKIDRRKHASALSPIDF